MISQRRPLFAIVLHVGAYGYVDVPIFKQREWIGLLYVFCNERVEHRQTSGFTEQFVRELIGSA